MSSYSGGSTSTEAYDAVSSGRSRHAESVKISHAPSQAGYGALPQIFFSVVHNPTPPIAKTRTQAPNTARPSLPPPPTIKGGPGTCGPAQCSASFQPAHRDMPGRQAQLLSGGGLPPGLSGGEPAYINASKPPDGRARRRSMRGHTRFSWRISGRARHIGRKWPRPWSMKTANTWSIFDTTDATRVRARGLPLRQSRCCLLVAQVLFD